MRQLIFIIIIFSSISCSKLISTATKPVVDCLATPFKNKELQTLQSNLVSFWMMNDKKWPDDKLALIKFSDSTGSALSSKFTNLKVINLVDSVLADYQLAYEMSDSTEYKNIFGAVCISIRSDTIINIRYKIDRIEMKNGVICMNKN